MTTVHSTASIEREANAERGSPRLAAAGIVGHHARARARPHEGRLRATTAGAWVSDGRPGGPTRGAGRHGQRAVDLAMGRRVTQSFQTTLSIFFYGEPLMQYTERHPNDSTATLMLC